MSQPSGPALGAALLAPTDTATRLRVPAELLADQERLLLTEATLRLTRCLEPDRVIHEVLQLMSELIGLNRGRVVVPDAAGAPGTLSIAHAYGLTRDEVARGHYLADEGITAQVMRTGVGLIVQDVDTEPAFLFRAVARATAACGYGQFSGRAGDGCAWPTGGAGRAPPARTAAPAGQRHDLAQGHGRSDWPGAAGEPPDRRAHGRAGTGKTTACATRCMHAWPCAPTRPASWAVHRNCAKP